MSSLHESSPLTTTDLPMRVISPRKVSGALSVSMSAAPWETARESLILPQCVRLHGGRGRVPGRAVLEAMPRADGSGPCFGGPTESSAFNGTGGVAAPPPKPRKEPHNRTSPRLVLLTYDRRHPHPA